jgi:diguanylate cyclase (GGDEF)-like protein
MMNRLSKVQKTLLLFGLGVGIGLLGAVDLVTGSELSLSVFYLFPVGVGAWYIGRTAGVLLAVESTFIWYLDDIRSGIYSATVITAWNAGVRLITFLVVAMLLVLLREILGRETQYARIDYLTKAANVRAFYEAVETRIAMWNRNRRPFSILYLDVDNFKQLNDGAGHAVGNALLQATAAALKKALRPEDTVARLGGDEFAVLLAETDGPAAEAASQRVRTVLRRDPGGRFGVTYSIGVLTCRSDPGSVDDLIHEADSLMYAAKRGGKDAVVRGESGGRAAPERGG